MLNDFLLFVRWILFMSIFVKTETLPGLLFFTDKTRLKKLTQVYLDQKQYAVL